MLRSCHARWLENKNCYEIYTVSLRKPKSDVLALVTDDQLEIVEEWARVNGYGKVVIDK